MCVFSTQQEASGALVTDHFCRVFRHYLLSFFLQAANNCSASLVGVTLILCQLVFHSQGVLKRSVGSICEDLQWFS